ncbi:abortive infection family protein [Pinirhizobacter soli]|uniref:abortive infection family protein n=1 Tax=Pinirhizobacter soli TaxID=2786953 RepID=UPI00202A6982|nr:abortive infection family protein [Pinirhizobacter soli]
MDAKGLDAVLGTVHDLLIAEDMNEAAQLVRAFPARAEQTGYDNWNGGTELWEVYFDVPPVDYSRLGARRSQIEEQITARLKVVLESETQDWYSAKIVPLVTHSKDWRAESSNLPREVRVNIIDGLRLENVHWQGRLDDVEFLNRLYDLQKLPSHDIRFPDAAGDIWQHCINNDDWDTYWVFSDERFGLADGSADTFLRFLCETVHPVVRPERDQAIKIVSHYNDQLKPIGWEILEEERIGGRPRFAYRQLDQHGKRAVSRARTVADALDAGWMAKAIERMERAIDTDPELAIGTAKELVESCCKTILTKRKAEFSRGADINDLTKLLVKELKLVPEDVSDQVRGAENIRLILRNLTQLTHNLAQLRGLYGTGHGKDGQHRGLQARHARLAVASAVAFIDFAADTYRHREELMVPMV